MDKSSRIRTILREHQTVYTMDVARKVGCTQPLIFQVIRAMKDEGEVFDETQVGRQVTYRLLTSAEADKRRADRDKFQVAYQRRLEEKRIRELIAQASAILTEVSERLERLAA